MSKLSITVASAGYDRVAAIRDGQVGIEGCTVNFMTVGPEELFFRAYRNTEFDICELSMSSYLASLSHGRNQYVAIPVFLSRQFRHSAIYVRSDRGIEQPKDLVGRKVGVPEYQVTAALWVRGFLDDVYDVPPSAFSWFHGGLHEPGRSDKVALDLPAAISYAPIPQGETLNRMLLRGDLDAVISPRAPDGYRAGATAVRRLFEDFKTVEQEYFRSTGIFPIMHVVGIRKALVDAHPWLANSVFDAFQTAKDLALEELRDTAAFHVTLPWLASDIAEAERILGADFWPYGVESNRATLQPMLGYAHRHGTSARRLDIDEIFVPTTLDRHKV